LATLFGMTPAPVEHCRVLELGCGNGSNLIPMACALPRSRFAGVDLAGTQIAAGRAEAAALELDNLELHHLDILDVGREFGEFDYVVAHGFYSWAPPAVRERIFAICRANLAPDGVAYVSYNTFPGGHLRRLVREILLHHVREIREPQERIRQAFALARYISAWRHDKDNERDLMRAEFERVLSYDPSHFYHDDLAEINSPVYFHEFMEQAARHGLQYLSEADLYEMQPPPAEPEGPGAPRLPSPDDLIAFEQYIDFVRCRRFRQTLLCHAGIRLDRSLAPSRLAGLYLASPMRAESETPDLGHGTVEQFVGPRKSKLATDSPAAKAAIQVLSEIWPSRVEFEDLLQRSRARTATQAGELAAMLLKMYAANIVEVSAGPARFTVEVSERPQASRVVRRQLESGPVVINQLHRRVEISDERMREALLLADGTRDLAGLRRELAVRFQTPIEEQPFHRNLQAAAQAALLIS
ncbi:MAG: methyltransferase regulatory domain-containing protein, partial [Acidobacteria bacterium]|nr:methyltransferase regulatory domain-containing protein [Acidobacteriota bacterium]